MGSELSEGRHRVECPVRTAGNVLPQPGASDVPTRNPGCSPRGTRRGPHDAPVPGRILGQSRRDRALLHPEPAPSAGPGSVSQRGIWRVRACPPTPLTRAYLHSRQETIAANRRNGRRSAGRQVGRSSDRQVRTSVGRMEPKVASAVRAHDGPEGPFRIAGFYAGFPRRGMSRGWDPASGTKTWGRRLRRSACPACRRLCTIEVGGEP